VDADKLFFPGGDDRPCVDEDHAVQLTCPLAEPGHIGRAGLIWVGKAHYKTTDDFTAEASRMGISRRITGVPRGFKLGETWVLLAHLNGIRVEEEGNGTGLLPDIKKFVWRPAIFTIFRPTAIEYVITGEESEEELEQIVERGVTPVEVINPGRRVKFPLAPLPKEGRQ